MTSKMRFTNPIRFHVSLYDLALPVSLHNDHDAVLITGKGKKYYCETLTIMILCFGITIAWGIRSDD